MRPTYWQKLTRDPADRDGANTSLDRYLDGMSLQRQELSVVIDGGEVYLDVQAIGGGNIDYYIDSTKYTLDCTAGSGVDGKARVQLMQGTTDTLQNNIIYVAVDENGGGGLQLYTSAILPNDSFAFVAKLAIWDDIKTGTDGIALMQRMTEVISHNGRSAIAWARESSRYGTGDRLVSGCDQDFGITTNAGSEDNLTLSLTNGVIFQLHRQNFPNYDISTDGIWVANSDGAGAFNNYTKATDLNTLLNEIKDGTSLNDGDSINVFIWGAINYEGQSKLFVNLPSGKYTVDADCVKDTNDTLDTKIPNIFRTVSFPVARLILKWNTADNGTWSNLLTDTVTVWRSDSANVSSPNYPSNYGNSENEIYTLTKAGALKVRVHFDDFNTEANYDFAELRNGTDSFSSNVTQRRLDPLAFDGALSPFTSPEITGTTIRVNFTSDGSVTRKGFHIDRLEYLITAAGAGSEIKDLRGSSPEFVF